MPIRIHTFGDSHSSSEHSHWGYVDIPNVEIICHHQGPKLMYSFGRQGLEILDIREDHDCYCRNKNRCHNRLVENGDTVIFCYGEIDCRNHVYKHVSDTKNHRSIIDEMVESYFSSISENIILFENITTCVFNVVPPHRYRKEAPNHPFPFLGSDEERKSYHLYANLKIKELCGRDGYIFFDIYDELTDDEGFLKKSLSDGNVHLKDCRSSTRFIQNYLMQT